MSLLRIFVRQLAHEKSLPLYEAIVLRAREMHLAGATVVRGVLGFGHSGQLQRTAIMRLSDDLPVIIEIIDAPEKIERFLPVLEGMMHGGIVVLQQVRARESRTQV